MRCSLRAPAVERITRKQIYFRRPFCAGGLDIERSAGTYEVELVEEMVGLSFPAYRLVSASVVFPLAPGSHSYELLPIEPALVREAEREMQSTQDRC